MSQPTGVILSARFEYFKNGAPYDPSPLPTLIDARYPDATVLTPLPSLSHPSTGVFTANVFTALQNTQIGGYSATAYTSDSTVDGSQYLGYEWSDVGINNVTSIANGVIAAATFAANALGTVWDELAANHTLADSFGLLLGSGSASAAAIWNYIIGSTLSAGNTLSAIYQKTLASPIQFINPFIVVNKTLGPIVAGDAYTTANNRQIDLPVPGNVPINNNPTLKLPNEDGTEQTITGTAVQINSQWYARFQLTSVQTSTLAISSAGQKVAYGAKATATADGTILTVQQGDLIVVSSL